MVRAHLKGTSVSARPTSQDSRCCCNCMPSWTESPSAGPRGAEVAKQLKEDSSTRQSRCRGPFCCSRSRSTLHKSELQWCYQIHILGLPYQTQKVPSPLPSPSTPTLCKELLNCSLSDLHHQPWQWKSRSRMQIGGAPTHTIGHPHSPPRLVAECLPLAPAQKQVMFGLADDLGNASSLPMDLANSF